MPKKTKSENERPTESRANGYPAKKTRKKKTETLGTPSGIWMNRDDLEVVWMFVVVALLVGAVILGYVLGKGG